MKNLKKALASGINNECFIVAGVTKHFEKRVVSRGLDEEEVVSAATSAFKRNYKLIYKRFFGVSKVNIRLFDLKNECAVEITSADRCPGNENGEKMLVKFVTVYPFSGDRLTKAKKANDATCFY